MFGLVVAEVQPYNVFRERDAGYDGMIIMPYHSAISLNQSSVRRSPSPPLTTVVPSFPYQVSLAHFTASLCRQGTQLSQFHLKGPAVLQLIRVAHYLVPNVNHYHHRLVKKPNPRNTILTFNTLIQLLRLNHYHLMTVYDLAMYNP